MKLLKIGSDSYIVADNVAYITDNSARSTRRLIHAMDEEHKVYRTNGKEKVRSVIVCSDNRIYLTSVTIQTLLNRLAHLDEQIE